MLPSTLHHAGFFPILWLPADSGVGVGTTYVRPSAQETLRVFVPSSGEDIEVYAGSLFDGKLRYRGPVRTKDQLLALVSPDPMRRLAA